MPIYEHHHLETFPQYHENDMTLYIELNLPKNKPLVSIKHQYEELINRRLLKAEKEHHRYIRCLIKRMPKCFKRCVDGQRAKKVADEGGVVKEIEDKKEAS
jgi:hypothetical protein